MNDLIEEIKKESQLQAETIKVLQEKIPEQFSQYEENLKLKDVDIENLKSELAAKKYMIVRYQNQLKECKKQLPGKLEKKIPLLQKKIHQSAVLRKSLGNKLGNI